MVIGSLKDYSTILWWCRLAVDLLPFPEIPNVRSLQGDFLSVPLRNQLRFCLEGRPFDVIVLNMKTVSSCMEQDGTQTERRAAHVFELCLNDLHVFHQKDHTFIRTISNSKPSNSTSRKSKTSSTRTRSW
jgi:23S rRNA U2552 (ribose-2'-O)-methylase RlmE/FtsJ